MRTCLRRTRKEPVSIQKSEDEVESPFDQNNEEEKEEERKIEDEKLESIEDLTTENPQ